MMIEGAQSGPRNYYARRASLASWGRPLSTQLDTRPACVGPKLCCRLGASGHQQPGGVSGGLGPFVCVPKLQINRSALWPLA